MTDFTLERINRLDRRLDSIDEALADIHRTVGDLAQQSQNLRFDITTSLRAEISSQFAVLGRRLELNLERMIERRLEK